MCSHLHPPLDLTLSKSVENVMPDSSSYAWAPAARGAVTEDESSLPGDTPLLFFLHHVEFGLSLLQLFLLLLDFLQQFLTLLQEAFLQEQEHDILQQLLSIRENKGQRSSEN